MDWRERYDAAAERYAAGETRGLDERQLVQLGNAAPASGSRMTTETATSRIFRCPTQPWRWTHLTRGVGSTCEVRATRTARPRGRRGRGAGRSGRTRADAARQRA